MPSDIVGTEILEEEHATGKREFRFQQGPVFTQVLLADEINRAPPKTQSALLEAMQERAVTFAGQTHKLPKPFFVLATQNPIEQAGTYPLPEAQLDRLLFKVLVEYPTATISAPTSAGGSSTSTLNQTPPPCAPGPQTPLAATPPCLGPVAAGPFGVGSSRAAAQMRVKCNGTGYALLCNGRFALGAQAGQALRLLPGNECADVQCFVADQFGLGSVFSVVLKVLRLL
eukprot:gene20357-28825_t